MSNEALTWAYRQKTGKGAGCKAVLVALADFADQDGSCYPGQGRLAQMTEQNVRTVRNHVDQLISIGLIRCTSRYTDGQRTSNRYFLLMDNESSAEVGRTRTLPESAAGRSLPESDDALPESDDRSPASAAGYPLEEPLEEPPDNARASKAQLERDFLVWYDAYPRRQGRAVARAKYILARAKPDVTAQLLLDAARRFARDPNRTDEFTPHPSTWLFQERWADDPLPERGSAAREAAPARTRPSW